MDRSRKSSARIFRKFLRRGAFCLAAVLLASCSRFTGALNTLGSRTDPQPQEITVPVVRGDITSSMNFVGNLQYSQSATLTWKTGGVIGSVAVKPGDRVRKGDILAVLEPESLSSSVLISEKTVIEQQERLEDLQSSETARMLAYQNLTAKETALKNAKLKQEALYYPRATREEMERAWDKLALADLNFNYAKQDYETLVENNANWTDGAQPARTVYIFGRTMTFGADDRSSRQRKFEDYVSAYNSLVSAYETYEWTTGEPSATDYAVAEGNVRVAQMEYDKALEDYLSYEELPREKDVNAAEILLNNAEAVYEQRFITAPFDGTVTAVDAAEGRYVTRGSAAVRVDDMTRIFIPVSIPELDLSTVTVGTAVTVTVDAISGKTYSGHIASVAEAGTTAGAATSFSAMVEVNDPDSRMLAGMTAEVSMPLQPRTGVLLIPNSAISYPDGTPSVTVTDGETRRTVGIRLGTVGENISEVISGNLPEGTLLVVSSITPETLSGLGLDPASVTSGAPVGTNGRQQNASDVIFVRSTAEAAPTAAPESGQDVRPGPAITPKGEPSETGTAPEAGSGPGRMSRPAERSGDPAEGTAPVKNPVPQTPGTGQQGSPRGARTPVPAEKGTAEPAPRATDVPAKVPAPTRTPVPADIIPDKG